MVENEKFLYTIHPKRRISGLSDGLVINHNKTVSLNKDDVIKCLKVGIVYRRFSSDFIQRVTITNIDRMHMEKYLSDEEFEKLNIKKLSEGHGTINNNQVVVEQNVIIKEEPEVVTNHEPINVEPVLDATEEYNTEVAEDIKEEELVSEITEVNDEEVVSEDNTSKNVIESRNNKKPVYVKKYKK